MDNQELSFVSNLTDDEGNPAGGSVRAVGLEIEWQDGPLGRGEERKEPNGAFVETVLRAAVQRLQWYQEEGEGKFACSENGTAIVKIQTALDYLAQRTVGREARGVEGTHEA